MRKSAASDSILYLDGISVRFDGFQALNNLSFMVARGELRAIIGPNGAGKTTMMDVVTGKTRADSGVAVFNGVRDLLTLDETEIANLGIGRKFQKPTVFDKQSVFANLELALYGQRRVRDSLFFRLNPTQQTRIDDVLHTVRLTQHQHRAAGELSHGQKQWLEIGMLLMQDPELLLIDEPAAGMTDSETAETATLLRQIAGDRSVIVVEHDMAFIRALDCRVTVLNEGAVLAEGTLAAMQADARVIESYLGR